MTYRDFKIPKKGKGFRLVSAPSPKLKAFQQRHLSRLQKFFKHLNYKYNSNKDMIHGFVKNRNAVTMARKHIGYETTMFFDIEDFFNNITVDKINNNFPVMMSKVKDEFRHLEDSYRDSYLAQGFCTSPILAAIYSIPLMAKLDKELKKLDIDHVCTIYADDICVSFMKEKDYKLEKQIENIVLRILNQFGLTMNIKKTRTRRQSFGARRILGINVYEETLEPTRRLKGKIRCIRHQIALGERKGSALGGLITWSLNRPPKAV